MRRIFLLIALMCFVLSARAETKQHIVVHGNSMYQLALDNGVSLNDLLACNAQYKHWVSEKTGFLMVLIKPGDVVQIPDTKITTKKNVAPTPHGDALI